MTGEKNTRFVGSAAPPYRNALVIMDVSGSGRSTAGAALAQRLGVRQLDADEFHPPHNIRKVRAGTPLTGDDRMPWLERLRAELDTRAVTGESVVLACSALEKSYRDVLRRNAGTVRSVHLRAGRGWLAERPDGGSGHSFPAALVDSQLDAPEEPTFDEGASGIAATDPPGTSSSASSTPGQDR